MLFRWFANNYMKKSFFRRIEIDIKLSFFYSFRPGLTMGDWVAEFFTADPKRATSTWMKWRFAWARTAINELRNTEQFKTLISMDSQIWTIDNQKRTEQNDNKKGRNRKTQILWKQTIRIATWKMKSLSTRVQHNISNFRKENRHIWCALQKKKKREKGSCQYGEEILWKIQTTSCQGSDRTTYSQIFSN